MKRLLSILLVGMLLTWAFPIFAAAPMYPNEPYSGELYRSNLYSRVPGYALSFQGVVTSTTNNDSLTIGNYDYGGGAEGLHGGWQYYGIDDYIGGGEFMLRVIMTLDSAAPLSQERPIVAFDSDAGLVIVSPAFSAVVVASEIVAVIHRSLCGKDWGLPRYKGTAAVISTGDALGTLQTAVDSVYVLDLAGFGNDYFNLGDYWFHYLQTTDGAAPQDQWRAVLDYVSASGLFTFAWDFTVTATIYDRVELVHVSLVPENVRPGQPFYTSVVASGNTVSAVLTDLIGDFPDDYFQRAGYYIQMDYTTDGAAPLGNISVGTDWANSTGTITFSPAISATVTAGDQLKLLKPTELNRYGDGIPLPIISPSPTAADDSVACWTSVGNCIITSLYAEILDTWASAADSCRFIADAAIGAAIVRIDKGEEFNAAAIGTVFSVAASTLGTATTKTTGGSPFPNGVFRLFVTDGTVIKFIMRGAATTGIVECGGLWLPAEPGAYIR